MNLQESIKRILREETEYVKDVRVKISDILKTNRDGQSLDDAIVNVQDGLKSYSEEPPFLLKIGDKYEVLDGFHRIAQKILDGKKYIISNVMIKESNMNLQESIRRILREETKKPISEIVRDEVDFWFNEVGVDACEINKGECFVFAERLENKLRMNGYKDVEVLTTDLFYDLATEYAKEDEEIWYNEKDYNSVKPEGLNWPKNGYHGWVYVGGKHYDSETIDGVKNFYDLPIFKKYTKKPKLQESIKRIINEVRVPRSERVELYKDNNIIVVVPLTHRALQKYANRCQWCINDDLSEWDDYHKGKHAVIIQRNPKKVKMGITGNPTASEIFMIGKWDNNQSTVEDIEQILNYEFRSERSMGDYYVNLTNDINNFATNIVYYSPENGIYDMEDNFLWNYHYEISDIPNVTPEVIKIMDDYLENE